MFLPGFPYIRTIECMEWYGSDYFPNLKWARIFLHLYRSLQNKSNSKQKQYLPKYGQVFCMSHHNSYKPKHITKRIVNQTGWFTSHYYGKEKNTYSALNNLKPHWLHLYRITFSTKTNEFRSNILKQLNTFGINSYSIFPDLEGLTKYLDWKTYKK